MEQFFNSYGQKISGIRTLISPKYGTGEKDDRGEEKADWENNLSPFADKHGFDKRHNEKDNNYTAIVQLKLGTIIERYGPESGQYTSPYNSDYNKLGLPYIKETVEYHKYQVIADSITVKCIVTKGIVAPAFNSPGGAIQYFHDKENMISLVKRGQLVRI